MRTIGLLFLLVLLALGVWGLIFTSFPSLSFNWQDLLIYLAIALIVYGIVWAVGGSLDKKFVNSVKAFLEGTKTTLFDDRGLIRVFGFLLIVLLPFLLYLLALALYSAITFALYGYIALSYLPRVPVVLLIGLAIVAIGTGVAILIGLYYLLFPPQRKAFGVEVRKEEQKRLWHKTNEIAAKIKAKPINKIVVTPDPGIGVYLQGSIFWTIFGGGRRVLELGLPSLHDLNVDEFGAILAHEYGHFSNRDTQWNSFTYSMGSSLLSTLRSIPGPARDEGGDRGILRIIMSINPGYWILYVFVVLYFRITSGFSRIGEVMADIMAMNLYGGKAFRNGLLKVVSNDAIFGEVVLESVRHFAQEGKVITNFSKFMKFAYDRLNESDIERIRSAVLSQNESRSAYDSHPSVKARLDYANRFGTVGEEHESLVYSLFDDWDKINEKVAELYNLRLGIYVARIANAEAYTEVTQAEEITEQDTLGARNQPTYAGDVKMCFYHEGRNAVNTCSRCGQPICSECNYVTGTQPICRSCWDKRVSA